MKIKTINPATEEVIKSYTEMSQTVVDQIIDKTQSAFEHWAELDFSQRGFYLNKIAELLEQRKELYGKLITTEMGKPLNLAIAEVEKCARNCRYYAEKGAGFLAPQIVNTEFKKSYVCYQPLGIIFAIMPWNFPFWQVFRCAAPTLMAGNTIILRHSANVTGCALAIEKLFEDAGLPAHTLSNVIINHDMAGYILRHPLIKAATITGSVRAGGIVASIAGSVIKKIVLELGGNDPYLILKDADLEIAAEACVKSRLSNSGQVCIAAKRIIVDNAIKEKFTDLILEKVAKYKMGNPLEAGITLGPLARADLRDKVHDQVKKCVAGGAKCLLGGTIPQYPGFFYPPTILTHVANNNAALSEEIFGPVICLLEADNEATAIKLANESAFGLAGAVFTQDLARGERIAKALEVGTCYVNDLVSSDPRLPFGGIKNSGYGRELGEVGIREFVNIKTISIK